MRLNQCILFAVAVSASFSVIERCSGELIPFSATGDLFFLEDASNSILRVDSSGVISTAVTEAQILAATGLTDVRFTENGLAFNSAGDLFFTESVSDAVLKYSADTVTVLASTSDLFEATGDVDAQPNGITVGTDGMVYVIDGISDSVVKIDPVTGDVALFTAESTFDALPGITDTDMDHSGIVADTGGDIVVLNDGTPDNVFRIDSTGTPSILTPTDLGTLDEAWLTRDAAGDFLIASPFDEKIFKLSHDDASQANGFLATSGIFDQGTFVFTPATTITTVLDESDIIAITGTGDTDLEGIAFDSQGNFFVADEESGEGSAEAILRFDSSFANGTIFISEPDILAVTGAGDVDFEGIAFAPAGPSGIPELHPTALMGLMAVGLVALVFWDRRKRRIAP